MASATEYGPRALGSAALLLALALPLAAAPGWDSRVTLGWSLLTERNNLAADYQDLRGQVRLATPTLGRRAARFHLDLRARQGLQERYFGDANPYESRRQVRAAFLEMKVAGGVLQAGRHLPELRAIVPWSADGITWTGHRADWSAGFTGGYQVPFWRANLPISRGAAQWGSEMRWHPRARAWEAGAAFLRDQGDDGAGRWRLGLDGRWRAGASLEGTVRTEVDPTSGRWLSGQTRAAWRSRTGRSAGAGYGQRLPSAWPVPVAGDTGRYGSRVHDLTAWASQPWGSSTVVSLHLRATRGGRRLRTEQLVVQRRGLPLLSRANLTLAVSDSWSRWRQLEQLSLQVQTPWRRRWSGTFGAVGTAFRWEPDRRPEWRFRARPHLGLRFAPGRGLTWDLRVEEEIDEFQHLRTRAAAGLTWTH
ncbi:MAG: hypothetical protein WDA75_14665 [Candidatus Latescibacterota bacterium]|jgi:hypothetical protein